MTHHHALLAGPARLAWGLFLRRVRAPGSASAACVRLPQAAARGSSSNPTLGPPGGPACGISGVCSMLVHARATEEGAQLA